MNPMEHFIRSMGRESLSRAINEGMNGAGPVPNTPMPKIETSESFNKRLAAIESHVNNLEVRMQNAGAGFTMVGQHIADLVGNVTRLGDTVYHNAAVLDQMDRGTDAMQKLLDENAKLKQSNSEFLDRVDKAELEVEWLKTDNAMLERYIAKVGGDLGRVRNPQPVAKKSKPKKKTPAK